MMKKAMIALPVLVIVAVLSLPFWLTAQPISLRESALAKIGQLLGSLFVISLFLERALDVFLTTWRAPATERLDSQILSIGKEISKLEAFSESPGEADTADTKELNQLIVALDKARQDRMDRSSRTRLIALWSGLAFGLLISAVGVRTLQTLAEPESLSRLPRVQMGLLYILDVFLTGGLIAGGSDGVHKLIEVYRSVMEASVARAKRASGEV